MNAMNGQGSRLLVWLGHPFFSGRMPDVGWRVVRRSYTGGELFFWKDVLALTGGETPDAVFLADGSLPPALIGVEDFPCLTVFHSVDSHIHSWHPFYAQGFDLCLVSAAERLQSFRKGRLDSGRVIWSPNFALDDLRPPETPPPKEWDLLFVGTLNPARAPERCTFLENVRERLPESLHAVFGDFAALFPKARLVLNECSGNELNFRVFEALGMGACLLTPDIGPAMSDLFADGRELFLYPAHDADALAVLTRRLLADQPLRERVAAAGLAAVDAAHRASHRAAALAARLDSLLASGEAGGMIAERLASAPAIRREVLRPLYLHHAESTETDSLRRSYLEAGRR